MRVADQLPDKQKRELKQMKSPKKENLSFRDTEELMDTRWDEYERRNGAVMRK
jgi:hypothetical protein